MYVVRVSSNGRVTIPIAIRRRLGINPGDVLDIHVEDNKIIMKKVETATTSSKNDQKVDPARSSRA